MIEAYVYLDIQYLHIAVRWHIDIASFDFYIPLLFVILLSKMVFVVSEG